MYINRQPKKLTTPGYKHKEVETVRYNNPKEPSKPNELISLRVKPLVRTLEGGATVVMDTKTRYVICYRTILRTRSSKLTQPRSYSGR